ncbi:MULTISPECIES: FKBP-type peptidyl-prolyl cis-trans isomerase N-terminal domain-containing protein [unclassified Serratia (in: enterobacteria)]|uniref:FKBP-type peptidyl-prolyl cis-trans isomerase N-terminal domain-containing protein n=1 Tax=unclassified Serratia (in: enterobacteria) TaxID=2647522 RepID=UPI002ED14D11|nr:FKBP-type peptidyl-prolyl cis-trans isomerase N-terminal domain-containing protein [Serratia sp. C2(2)]MEE4449662.1 FKBP-type peptidyl-prolyl cis-trans isomerase N-terminal domain-containing protein [Serratia sp. C2(1)]
MTRRYRLLAGVLLPLLWGTERVQADEGVPALLQFAEQYRDTQPADAQAKPAEAPARATPPKTARPATAPATLSDSPTLRRALKERDAQLAKQQALLQRQAKELVRLRQSLAAETARHQQAASEQKPANWAPLQKLVSGLRQAASGRPDEQRATALITEARASAERERVAVQEAHGQVKALKGQINDLKRRLQAGDAEKTDELRAQQALTTQQQALTQQLEKKAAALVQAQRQLTAAQAQQDALRAELKALQTEQKDKRTALTARQEKETAALAAQLATNERQRAALEKKTQDLQLVIEQKEATLSALQQENTTLQQQQVALIEQAGKAEADLAKQAQTLHQVQSDVEVLQARAKWLAKPETLSKPAGQQAYAAGGALGRDILTMLNERKAWGVDTDQQTVLAGVVDAFAGQYQLTTDVLTRALADSEAAVNAARTKAAAAQHKKGETFVANFKKQKGVKQSPAGFWYRVDYAGDAPLRDTDMVDVVVKETLTDGTVIQDMSLSGNVLSQPLNAYPPLFREAIGHLKSHGSLTMVVPPALAYGDDGYPPKVPPNATMVYELRIDNSKAAPGT